MAYFDKFGVEFTDDRKTLVRCPEDFKGEYIIPDGVTSIGRCAFYGCSGYKWPSLPELYQILFGRDFENAHDALADITATKECFFELKRRGIIKK